MRPDKNETSNNMRHKTIIVTTLTLSLIFISCDRVKEEKKTLDFGLFTIEVPRTWEKVKRQGIDSYVGQIAIDETDTLEFDLGWYSNSLKEVPNFRVEQGRVHVLNEKLSKSDSLVYDFAGTIDTVDIDKFLRDSVTWTTIDNRKAKLVQPKKSGRGTTGVYIDSLWAAGSDIDKFEINGQNLKPDNERLFIQAIKTLRFKSK
jgi:hypothetical protein